MDIKNSMLLANMMNTEEKKELFITGINQATISLPNINGAYKLRFKGKVDFSLIYRDVGLWLFGADSNDSSGRDYVFKVVGKYYTSSSVYVEIDNYYSKGTATSVVLKNLYPPETTFDVEYNLDNISNLSNLIFLCYNWTGQEAKGIMFSLFEIFDSSNNKLLSITPKIENNVNGVYDSISQNFYTNTTGTLIITE